MLMSAIDKLKQSVKGIPNSPGVYLYFDKHSNIIYIGKAKDLKKRVASYFNKNQPHTKTRILVRNIVEIKYIVVETETDALLLENNLIKKHQPRYNILLKDDKSFPWVCVKNEPFPRVFFTRHVVEDGSKYYGPYTDKRLVRSMIDFFKQLYPLRTCKLDLSEKKIETRKYKVCLEYHIGNCKAPCIGNEQAIVYDNYIEHIKKILSGRVGEIIQNYRTEMKLAAENLEFERAQKLKEKLLLLENYQSKSVVLTSGSINVEVFSIDANSKFAYLNFLRVVNGAIIQVITREVKKVLDETDDEILLHFMTDIYQMSQFGKSVADEIIVPFHIDFKLSNAKIVVPKIGDKKQLQDLSFKNIRYYRLEKEKQRTAIDPQKNTNRILETLKKDLNLDVIPRHIECFDNSNFQGAYPVSACVVFRDAKPSTKEYRHFNVKTVTGIDDFASMYEVVYRRYRRMLDEDQPLPQLIVIDGGKGQLSSAYLALQKLDIQHRVAIIGIAKRLEEIFFPNDSIPLYIDKTSESLKVIQHARNEAHRFGITFHRNKRSKGTFKSELDDIKGIGPKNVALLLTELKSIEAIRHAKIEELEKVIGKSKAKIIFDYFNQHQL